MGEEPREDKAPKKRKTSNSKRGAVAEAVVVAQLNKWARMKEPIFSRRGYGKKGDDVECSLPNWDYSIEIKLTEIPIEKVVDAVRKEVGRKKYKIEKLWFIFRHNGRIWISVHRSIWPCFNAGYERHVLYQPLLSIYIMKLQDFLKYLNRRAI